MMLLATGRDFLGISTIATASPDAADNIGPSPTSSGLVRRGAQLIASLRGIAGIDHIAFENPDGSHVLVVSHHGEGEQIQCQVGARTLDLDSDSVTLLLW
jgi:hypothetical protein